MTSIDAPESDQRYGQASKTALSRMIANKDVLLHKSGTDRYQRWLATVSVDGVDINLKMVAEGHAWEYVRYNNRQDIRNAQRRASSERRGLWVNDNPVPPWEYRRNPVSTGGDSYNRPEAQDQMDRRAREIVGAAAGLLKMLR